MSRRPFPVPQTRRPIAAAVAALAVQLPEAGGADHPPTEIRMLPAGAFRAVDGRPEGIDHWRIDHDLAQPIVAAAAARRSDYVIDYEHQTLLARENGKPAPAAGWYGTLEWRDDGLWATDVRWTPAAAAMIVHQEYRYISPVFGYDRQTGDVKALVCAALVSSPGLDGLTDLALMAAKLFPPLENPPMDDLLEQLQWLLNLPVGSTADEILARLTKLIDQIKADVPAAASAASFDLPAHLQAQQQRVAALAADLGQPPNPAQYVPMTVHAAVQGELASARASIEDDDRAMRISAALADGRILPATAAYWKAQPLAALNAYLEVATPISALSGMQTDSQNFSRQPALSTFSVPAGYSVDVDRSALHQRTLAYAKEHTLPYDKALQAALSAA